jgi:hypothetical protein
MESYVFAERRTPADLYVHLQQMLVNDLLLEDISVSQGLKYASYLCLQHEI